MLNSVWSIQEENIRRELNEREVIKRTETPVSQKWLTIAVKGKELIEMQWK